MTHTPPPASSIRYLVLAALCVATLIAYIDRGCLGVAEKTIRAELDLSKDRMSEVMSAFFVTYALFQLPAGWLGHVWGSRRALTLFAVLWSLATGLGAVATGYVPLLISRLGMGAAEAGIFPAATGTIARWFPTTRRAWASGMLGSFMGIGGALGAALTGLFLRAGLSWQMVLVLYAVAGLLWAGWFFAWFRDRPEDTPAVNEGELDLIRGEASAAASPSRAPVEPPGPTPWRAILTSPAMGWIAAQQFFRGAGFAFYMTWFPTFLRETRTVSELEAGILTSLPLGAQIFGSFAGGVLADWLLARTGSARLSRQGVACGSLLLAAGVIGLAYPIADALTCVLLISVGAVAAAMAGPPAYAVTIDMGGRFVTPVFSVMNMTGNLGAVCFPLVVQWLGDAQTTNWDQVFLLFVGLNLAAAVCWLPLDPNRAIVPDDHERTQPLPV